MYSENATIKRRSKTNRTKNKSGVIRESKTEIIEIKGLSIKTDFKDGEEVIIIKKDDLNQILEKEKNITQYEETINELKIINAELEEEISFLKKMNIPAPQNDRELEQELLYNLLLSNAIEEAIKIIMKNVSNEIQQANTKNIEELQQVYDTIKSDIAKQNNILLELKKETINIFDNVNNSITNFNKEFQSTSRLKILLKKNKLFFDMETVELKEALEKINKIKLINMADFGYIAKLLTIPIFEMDNSEVRDEIESGLKKMKNEFKKGPDDEIINI